MSKIIWQKAFLEKYKQYEINLRSAMNNKNHSWSKNYKHGKWSRVVTLNLVKYVIMYDKAHQCRRK